MLLLLAMACRPPAADTAAADSGAALLTWVEVEPRTCVAETVEASAAEPALDLYAALGVRAVRMELFWSRVEPVQGATDYSRYEAVIDGLVDRGIEPVLVLAYGNPWASSQTEDDIFYPPDDPADFAAYAGLAAARFSGRVRRWEVWNEQNAGYRFWKPDLAGDPVAYGALLAAAAEAVHAADPDAEVLIGGTFFHPQLIPGAEDFLAAMPAEAWAAVDGLAFHPYAVYPPQAPPEYAGPSAISGLDERPVPDMIAGLRAVAADAGRPELPLAVTEYGWPAWGEVTPALQADWAERAMLLGLAEGVGTWCGYTLYQGDGSTSEDVFGMAEADGALTPYGERIAALSARLDGVVRAAPLALPEGQHGVALGWADGAEARIAWGEGQWIDGEGEARTLSDTPTGWPAER